MTIKSTSRKKTRMKKREEKIDIIALKSNKSNSIS